MIGDIVSLTFLSLCFLFCAVASYFALTETHDVKSKAVVTILSAFAWAAAIVGYCLIRWG
jgi:hypothetical protein